MTKRKDIAIRKRGDDAGILISDDTKVGHYRLNPDNPTEYQYELEIPGLIRDAEGAGIYRICFQDLKTLRKFVTDDAGGLGRIGSIGDGDSSFMHHFTELDPALDGLADSEYLAFDSKKGFIKLAKQLSEQEVMEIAKDIQNDDKDQTPPPPA